MTATNLEEQLKLLVELQGFDSQILKIERELAFIPEEIKRAEGEFEAKKADLKKLEDGVKTLQLKRKEREVELQSKEDMVKKHQAQMYQVKTNKEYSALQQEIERIKADDSLIEEAIIMIFDQIDAENKKIAQEKEFLKVEEAKLNEEKARWDIESKRITGELGNLKVQRTALAEKCDKTILSKYERILQGKDGLAVVPVLGDSCQGCFSKMPSQVIHEIMMKKDLIFCENCARILYIEE